MTDNQNEHPPMAEERPTQTASPTEPTPREAAAPEAPAAPAVLPGESADSKASAAPTDAVEPASVAAPVDPVETVESATPVVAAAPAVPAAPAESAAAFVLPQEPLVPAPLAKQHGRRGRVGAVVGAVLLVGAVVGGVGYTVVTVKGADRDAGAPVWRIPAKGKDAKAAEPKGLAGMLVPYGADGWSRGPDIGEFGADAELSGDEATALRKQSLGDLPRTQRKRLEKQIDKERIKGMAMRSYVSTDEQSSVYTDKASTVSIQLSEMDNKAAVRNISEFQNEFLDALGLFRKGPRVEGHKNARCFLSPKEDVKIDAMYCSAYQGDVLVTVTARSAKPLQAKGIAMLLKEQLDRIAEPGEAV